MDRIRHHLAGPSLEHHAHDADRLRAADPPPDSVAPSPGMGGGCVGSELPYAHHRVRARTRPAGIRVGYAYVADRQQRIASQGLEQGTRRFFHTTLGIGTWND